MSGKGNWLGSKKGKTVMKHFFGWGAAIVIVGALFKIQHYDGSEYFLPLGLGVEALIFIVMIFVPDHPEYDWDRVHPILSPDLTPQQLHEMIENGTGVAGGGGGGSNADAVVKQLQAAGINDNLLSDLKNSMSNLASNAASLGKVSAAATETDGYVNSLKMASQNLNNLTEQYAKSAKAIAGIAEDGQGNFGAEMQKLGENMSALNNVYSSQLQSTQKYLDSLSSMGALQDSIKNIMTDLASSANDTKVYSDNMKQLASNLENLNNVYGNMLRAMKG
jgi:gliding motility-associated protein GldL